MAQPTASLPLLPRARQACPLKLDAIRRPLRQGCVAHQVAPNRPPSRTSSRSPGRSGVCRSREFWQKAVGTCGLSCQLPRRLDFFAEKSIEGGDEIVRRTLFYDVTDLLR